MGKVKHCTRAQRESGGHVNVLVAAIVVVVVVAIAVVVVVVVQGVR